MKGASLLLLALLVGFVSASYHRPRRRIDLQQQQLPQQLPQQRQLQPFNNNYYFHHPQQLQQQNVFQHHSISSPAQRQFYYRRSRQMLTSSARTADQLPAASSFGSRRLHTIENPHAITVTHNRDNSEEEQLRRIRLTLFLTQLQNHDSGAHQLILTDATTHTVPAQQQPQLQAQSSEELSKTTNKPKRRKKNKNKSKLREKQSGCIGRCTNMLSCMLQGGRTLRRSPSQGCFGLMEVCCVSQQQQLNRRRPRNRRRRRRRKNGGDRGSHGRALPHPLDSVSYSSKQRRPNGIHSSLENLVDGSLEILQQSLSGTRNYPKLNHNNLHLQHLGEVEEETCGLSRAKNVAGRRIMGGLDAGYGQFPWTAHVKIRGPGIDKECGGTLINSRWILTAGHCTQYCVTVPLCAVEVPQHEITYKVILGEYDQLSTAYYPPDSYHAIDVIRHPLYRNAMRFRENGFLESEPRYDAAMLFLDRKVKLAPNVAPICLPTEPFKENSPGSLGTVVGWGRVGRDESAPHSNILQAATVPILSDDECLAQTGLENFSDQMCAGVAGGDSSACPGDSGGALQVQDDTGRWTIVGVVSNGPSVCGLQPVVFHKVSNTLAWIHNVIERQDSGSASSQENINIIP